MYLHRTAQHCCWFIFLMAFKCCVRRSKQPHTTPDSFLRAQGAKNCFQAFQGESTKAHLALSEGSNHYQPQGWSTCAVFPSHYGCLLGGKVMFSFLGNLGTPFKWGVLIPGDPSYLGSPHTLGPLIPWDLLYLGTPHT